MCLIRWGVSCVRHSFAHSHKINLIWDTGETNEPTNIASAVQTNTECPIEFRQSGGAVLALSGAVNTFCARLSFVWCACRHAIHWRLTYRMRNHLELLLFYANSIKYTFHLSEAIRKWMTSFAVCSVLRVEIYELMWCALCNDYNLHGVDVNDLKFFFFLSTLSFSAIFSSENCHRRVVASPNGNRFFGNTYFMGNWS